MEKFRHLDLFSGIGGFALAASWVWGEQHEIVSFCEIEKFPQKVLKKHWPAVPIHDDIKTMKGDQYGRISLLTGGFPCQPYSVAGKQRGSEDDRALWPEMFRVIKETKPRWVIGENVAGFIHMGLEDSLSDLESEGYETTAFIVPACGVEAHHKRDRVWIVANRFNRGSQKRWAEIIGALQAKRVDREADTNERAAVKKSGLGERIKTMAHSDKIGRGRIQQQSGVLQKEDKTRADAAGCFGSQGGKDSIWSTWETEPAVDRVADGIPARVDRIRGLGNAIVPQVVTPIMQAIKQIDEMNYETV